MSRGDDGGDRDKEVKMTLDGSPINGEGTWTGVKDPQTFLLLSSLMMVTLLYRGGNDGDNMGGSDRVQKPDGVGSVGSMTTSHTYQNDGMSGSTCKSMKPQLWL